LSFNSRERTDKLVGAVRPIVSDAVDWMVEFGRDLKCIVEVFDNGSDGNEIPSSATSRSTTNLQMTGGMNALLRLARSTSPNYVWLLTNDILFEECNVNPILKLTSFLEMHRDVGIVHPALMKEPVPNFAYPWMVYREDVFHDNTIKMIDFVVPMFTKEALDVLGWEFDPRFTYGWGIDYDMCIRVREAGLKIAVDYMCLIDHLTSVTYDEGKHPDFKNRQEYYAKAMECMEKGMTEKYGKNWRRRVYE